MYCDLALRNLHNYTLVFKETITIGFKDFYLFLLRNFYISGVTHWKFFCTIIHNNILAFKECDVL